MGVRVKVMVKYRSASLDLVALVNTVMRQTFQRFLFQWVLLKSLDYCPNFRRAP